MKITKGKIIGVLAAIIVLVLFVGLLIWNIDNQAKSNINIFLEELCNLHHFSFLGASDSTEFEKYSKNKHFHDMVISNMRKYETWEDPEGEDPNSGTDKVIKLIGALNALGYDDAETADIFQEIILKKLNGYSSTGDFASISDTIALLDEFQIQNEAIKELFQNTLHDTQGKVFSGNSTLSLSDYIQCVNRYLSSYGLTNEDGSENNAYYATVLECYPYDAFVSCIKTNGQLVISTSGRGGYYDGQEEKYENKHYWVDPLFKTHRSKGEIGTYEYTEEHMLFGDFRVKITSKYWYMTDKNDPNNDLDAELYYKDDEVYASYEKITAFLKKVTNRNCYYYDNKFYVLEKDMITVFPNMFSIAYE